MSRGAERGRGALAAKDEPCGCACAGELNCRAPLREGGDAAPDGDHSVVPGAGGDASSYVELGLLNVGEVAVRAAAEGTLERKLSAASCA